MMLDVQDVSAGYGRRTVVSGASLSLAEGEVVALIGPNGAGKSTLMNATAGLLPLRSGRIHCSGTNVSSLGAARRVNHGLCLVPQLGGTFPDLTIVDNLELSARCRYKDAGERAASTEDVLGLFPVLRERARQRASTLSGGQRQMLALGIALVKRPRVLLLDEPSLGLSPLLAQRLLDNVAMVVAERRAAALIVEQNIREVLRVTSRAYVMRTGEIVLSGTSEEILSRTDLFTLL
jgi:branched-chain amino acid transport system ATP-binding protein